MLVPFTLLFTLPPPSTSTSTHPQESGSKILPAPSLLPSISSTSSRTYTSFNISCSHFPRNADKGTVNSYVVHDILAPFPEGYHAKFNVVHLRLLVLALNKEQIKITTENAAMLLKPRGHLQWEELETANLTFTPSRTPAITSVRAALRASIIANRLSNTPSIEIVAALEALSFQDIAVRDYNSVGREEFTLESREWTKGRAQAGLFSALLRARGRGGRRR